MLMLWLATLAAGAVERPVVVSALTTGQLVEQCQGKDNDPGSNFCTGYILGAFDALSLTHEICASPERASNIEVLAGARKYLRKHRKDIDIAPSFVIRDALREAFPCAPTPAPTPAKTKTKPRAKARAAVRK